jgi:hypothetical protein
MMRDETGKSADQNFRSNGASPLGALVGRKNEGGNGSTKLQFAGSISLIIGVRVFLENTEDQLP